ncbi:TBC1 domain family member 10A-like isoform X1 [Tachypleus tridentatus]|uniref:TBC1 domain family member 10A-like isoform X1 n=1 Tax=Tachypleus tridentatus TaxID=6853 RepID=UPI003FD48EEE
MASSCQDESFDDGDSDASSVITTHNGSIASEMMVDRYGFLGGNQYTDPRFQYGVSVEILRKRELKWLEMFENWERFMTKKYKKVRNRCRKGIPPSLRAKAWQNLCGASHLLEAYKYKFPEIDHQSGDPKFVEDIKKDLHRQFPFHEMFVNKQGHGQADLFRILKAYSIFNPAVGYCQAQAPVAAVLLMHMPAEQAFWCLVSICERYIPGYYSPGLEAVQLDGDIMFGLLKKVSPVAYKHLRKQAVEPILYMTEWLMCIFSRTLPWSCVLRIWDMFLCEGVKVLFRVAIVLLKHQLGRSDITKQCPSMYETLERIRMIPPEVSQEDFLIQQCLHLPLTEHELEKEHQKQVSKRRALRELKLIQEHQQRSGTARKGGKSKS